MGTLADVAVLQIIRTLHPDLKTSLNTTSYVKRSNPQAGAEAKPRAILLPDSALL
jgi:hypothetical protein